MVCVGRADIDGQYVSFYAVQMVSFRGSKCGFTTSGETSALGLQVAWRCLFTAISAAYMSHLELRSALGVRRIALFQTMSDGQSPPLDDLCPR